MHRSIRSCKTAAALLAAALLCAGSAGAQTSTEKLIDHVLANSKAYDHLSHLTDKIGPRLSGSHNAAIAVQWTTAQFRSWGISIDWSREFGTHEPRYYRWTQWIFLQLFRHGLAYRKDAAVKWCPVDQTVLANEQVIDGHCERCGAEVEAKQL